MSNTGGLREGGVSQPAIAKGHNSTSAMRRQEEAKFFDVMLSSIGFFIWSARKLSVGYLFGKGRALSWNYAGCSRQSLVQCGMSLNKSCISNVV